jgi:hypothetical protein
MSWFSSKHKTKQKTRKTLKTKQKTRKTLKTKKKEEQFLLENGFG